MSVLCATCYTAPATHCVMSDREAHFYPATAFVPGAVGVGRLAPLVPYCCADCAAQKAEAYNAQRPSASATREATHA